MLPLVRELLPPMAWDAWGDPALAKPLSAGIRSLLEQALGVSATEVAGPGIEDVQVAPSALTADHRAGPPRSPASPTCGTDDVDRLLHAGWQVTPDLLRRKELRQDAPTR